MCATHYSVQTGMIHNSRTIINVFGNQVVVSPDFRAQHPGEISSTILIADRRSGDVIKFIQNDTDIQDMMNVDDDSFVDPITLWDYFGMEIHRDSIFVDQMYDRLYVSDFLCNIDVFNLTTKKFDTKLCIKEHRGQDEVEDRLSNTKHETVFTITAKGSFIYVITNLYLYVLRRHDNHVLTSYKLSKQPIKVKFFSVTKGEKTALSNDENEIFINKLVFGFSDKQTLSWSCVYHTVKNEIVRDANGNDVEVAKSHFKVSSEGESEKEYGYQNYPWRRPFWGYVHSAEHIHSVDVNNSLAVCAAKDLKVSVFDLDTAKKYSITAGSKNVKSYKEHPQKSGVSYVKANKLNHLFSIDF